MPTPINPLSNIPPTTTAAEINPYQASAPIGISSQPSTLSNPPSSSCLSTIGNFFCTVYVTILSSIGNFTRFLLSRVQDEPRDLIDSSSDDWMLLSNLSIPPTPSTTVPAAATPIAVPPSDSARVATAPPSPPPPTTAAQPLAPPSPPDPFSLLSIGLEEMRKIYEVIHTLGTTHPLHLWPKQTRLEQLGSEIKHVHPLKFLEYILSHPTLRADLNAFRGSWFVWPKFLEGLSNNLTRVESVLPSQLPGFARAMQIDLAQLTPFLESKNWQEMVFLLLDSPIPVPVAPPAVQPPVSTPIETPPAATPEQETTAVVEQPPEAEPEQEVANLPPIVETPPPQTPWQQIALSNEQKRMLTEVVRMHREITYSQASIWGDRHIGSLWDRLDRAHPLAILNHLFRDQELVTELNLLWPYRLHWRYFYSELTAFLGRTTREDYVPYITDFSQAVQEDAIAITAHIHNQRWGDLIQLLR